MRRFDNLDNLHCLAAAVPLLICGASWADGTWLPKSGPIQPTGDGAFVWFVNPDHDTVSRMSTTDHSVLEFALPVAAVRNRPVAIAVHPTLGEVWVASQDSDQIYVLEAATGQHVATIPVAHGSSPRAIAFSPTGDSALIALYREGAVLQIDPATRAQVTTFTNMADKPLSIAFASNTRAFVAHQFNDGDHGYISVVSTSDAKLPTVHRIRSIDPKFNFQIPSDPIQVPEGGWLFPTSQLAIRPQTSEVWIPAQLQNFRATPLTSDTVIQAALLRIGAEATDVDLNNRIVFTAVFAHSQTNQLLGEGWNAGVAGPSDIAFSSDGSFALITMAHSNDLLVVPSTTGIAKPNGAPPLQEIPVGDNPIGVVWPAGTDEVYVLNYLSRDVSIINSQTWTETARVAAVVSQEPLDADVLLGAKIFNSSADNRISSNHKVSCASCHPGGETDGLVWDFSSIGAGRRKTLTMLGQSISMAPQANGRGQLHRSGDRDEIQDFDFTFSGNFMLGSGFLPLPNAPLDAPNAGQSPDLDAMAAFVLDLPPIMRSPHRKDDGELTDAAVRGAMLFRLTEGPLATGCITCHPAPAYTDFAFHDVGGFRPLPDFEGPAFNTPTLVSTWDSGGFRQVIPVGGAAITRQTGLSVWDVLRSTDSGTAQTDLHGSVDQLSHALKRDLEAFLNELDGDLAAVDLETLVDTTPPRIVAVLPVSMSSVEVIFSEAVDPVTASDPQNYSLTDGVNTLVPSAAEVNSALGNRVRLTVPLFYTGCATQFTLVPGPIADLAAELGAESANVLDVGDPQNQKSFTIDGTITVTFGDSGNETFPGVASDASFDPRSGQGNTSYDRMILNPVTIPETKGFVRFNFTDTLANQCGVTDPASIVDARFSLMPDFGSPSSFEVRRVFKPWGDPDRDNCISCSGAVTNIHARFNTVPWSISGARSLGGYGTSAAEYHPNQTGVDAAAAIDGTAALTDLQQRVEFSGPTITEAFRFWFANPAVNYGYMVETIGTSGPVVEFWSAEADGGRVGPVLAVTFSVPITPLEPDCNENGRIDSCDIALGESLDADESGIPDECEIPPCPADWNGNHIADVPDIFEFLADWFAMDPASDFDGMNGIEVPDIFFFLAAWFAGCPT